MARVNRTSRAPSRSFTRFATGFATTLTASISRPPACVQALCTDVFYWHGSTEILLNGKWVKATPAFNIELCDRFGLLPREFDGCSDSLYHPFDRSGHRHREYVAQRGSFDDVPLDRIVADFATSYPSWRSQVEQMQVSVFCADIDRESRG